MVLVALNVGCRGLYVHSSVLGAQFDLSVAGEEVGVRLSLPSGQQSFRPQHVEDWMPLREAIMNDQFVAASIMAFNVEVSFPDVVEADKFAPGAPRDMEALDKVFWLVKQARELCQQRAALFLEQLRATKQFWMGQSLAPLEILDGLAVYDDRDGDRILLPIGAPTLLGVMLHNLDDAADTEELERAAAATRQSLLPALPDRLLADARNLGLEGPAESMKQALFLAAIATEVRVKEFVAAVANEHQGSLVDILLNSPRDYSVSVHNLFDRPLLAVSGHSLKVDDPALYKAVGRLFTARNHFVHRGEEIGAEVIATHLQTAVGVRDYLQEVASGTRPVGPKAPTPPPELQHSTIRIGPAGFVRTEDEPGTSAAPSNTDTEVQPDVF
ncbi:hypothetical protein [Dactylosporangium sp. CA-092794]|uniref:hypothetical protein n=1 Tax=Dactylosporangium sp. CA-092794 TaxID=3239929 RepID=UPI003D948997